MATAILLMVGVAVVIGTITTLQLDASLRAQLDDRLTALMSPRGRMGQSLLSRLPEGAFAMRLRGGEVLESGLVTADGQIGPAPYPDRLPSFTGDITTVTLHPLGEYRLRAAPGPGGLTLVMGLPLDSVSSTLSRFIAVQVGVTLGALSLAALIGTAMVRRQMHPLQRLAATATEVSQQELSSGEVVRLARVPEADSHPGGEVGQVGAALNQMLGHIEDSLAARHDSEVRLRRFIADASHELRTPLASLAGYAELAGRDPRTQEFALRRIRSETARMTSLVEDLLLLARLDSGRPLIRDEVDLRPLLVNAVSDAYAASREHHWLVDFPDEAPTVTGDPDRLHQVISNLLANARVHTPPGTVVSTTLDIEDGELVIRVRDDATGIPADLLPTIFGRFTRGDHSRSRQGGGAGLGLAIVQAVTIAHGGRVEVASELGDTCFSVFLPQRRL
ncbi:two-component system, OmpR family, sensor kinase [Sinosporangium album]|uniref:histidine kinase n=1 Tax=Sinosporangium album TaxID=504805 RepID=A0A1G8HWI4_9ACTN|nr:HAMP domain-containing sensor histidine kinase [Sinosporangium album]SDI10830.1 two-component system, OmpR family, sensor kinase [Sinosporangium album]